MVKEYFFLQYKRIGRILTDFGIHPVVGCLIALLAFVGLSVFLFYKTHFAPYAYILIALYVVSRLSEIKRNDFLNICYSRKYYVRIRIWENLIMVFPFIVFLLCKAQFFPAIILVVLSALLTLSNFKTTYNFTFPTPFYKKPFEFTVGFRYTFYIFMIAYAITFISIAVDNLYLGIFALLLSFLTILTYHLNTEHEYFVWSYSLTPAKFLIEKIKTAFLFSSCICIPIYVALCIFYPDQIGITLLFALLGYLYLLTIILIKYAAYPDEIDFVQLIILTLSVFFPPALILVIPYFANQSMNKLNNFLK